jgi:hypothetical protein
MTFKNASTHISMVIVFVILIILIVNTNSYVQSFLIGIVLALALYWVLKISKSVKGGSDYYTSYQKLGGDGADKCLDDAKSTYEKSVDKCDEKNCEGVKSIPDKKACIEFGKKLRKANQNNQNNPYSIMPSDRSVSSSARSESGSQSSTRSDRLLTKSQINSASQNYGKLGDVFDPSTEGDLPPTPGPLPQIPRYN